MTGWAVVNGRNMLLFNDRLSLDVWHVDNLRIPLQSDQLFRSNPINCFGVFDHPHGRRLGLLA